jgi:hypothetical protein
VTGWVSRPLGVLTATVIALAISAPAAVATTARAAVPPAASGEVRRPSGAAVAAVLRLVGVQTCVDLQQQGSSALQECRTLAEDDETGAVVTTALRTSEDDLAADRLALASAAIFGFPAAHAVDGSLDTSWRTSGHEWWQVDLGRSAGLSAIVLNWDGDELPSAYSVLLSTDGTKWKRVVKIQSAPDAGRTVHETAAARGRYVRVEVKSPVAHTIALRDVRVHAAASSGKRASRDRRDDNGFASAPDSGSSPITRPAPTSPPSTLAALEPTESTGFGPVTDPLTTAAVLVIVLAGVTSLVVGAQTTHGRHKKRRRLLVPSTTGDDV